MLRGLTRLCVVAIPILVTALPGTGWAALIVPLNVEFDDGLSGDFGRVIVDETPDGGLAFQLSLGDDLGPDADMHRFYFNLDVGGAPLAIDSDDVVATPYTVGPATSVAGGAGSEFDFEVALGNGASQNGNDRLTLATFAIRADRELSTLDLIRTSETSQGIEVLFALHVQGTSLVMGSTSETVGGTIKVPEPRGLSLLPLLLAVGLIRRRRRAPHPAS